MFERTVQPPTSSASASTKSSGAWEDSATMMIAKSAPAIVPITR